MAEDTDQLAGRIVALIRSQQPDAEDVVVSALSQIVGGNSAEIWRFEAAWDGQPGGYILRRAAQNEFGSAGRAAEFQLLRALGDTPVPSPSAHWLDADGAILGRPAMVLERSPGVADRNLLRTDNKFRLGPAERQRLAGQMADILAGIHMVEVAGLNLSETMRAAREPAAQQLAFYDAEIARDEVEPMPELRLASLWLHEHLPSLPRRLALVHGDYRPANLLVEGDRISAVLDWEFAHEGDPAEDLGWYLSPYYAHEHLVPGAWEAEQFIARYEAACGEAVDRAAVHFWSVFAMYKLASMTVAALAAAAGGDVARLAPSSRFVVDPLLRSIVDAPGWAA